jgi:O-antigen/teichoic acid export membrane protein
MSRTAARGTVALVLTQGLYFTLGYLAVVLLAREMGPAAYGAYGVIMSVLVWLEQSARRVVPAAAAKLIAEKPAALGNIAQSSVLLNLVLHAPLFAALWLTAPWLEVWFHIENGTYLFRLAALDLPLYGIYTALQGIYQGQRRFYRLGLSDLTYALAKLLGIILIVWLGVSIEAALIVNIAASVVGIAFLFTRTVFARSANLGVHTPIILAMAAPLVLYSVASELALDIWILKAITPPTEAATIGIYVAALNIARVPGFALSTIARVLLPSVAMAVATNDSTLVRHYMNQAIRFFLIFYLPVCFVLFASPEALMQFVYSSSYAGGADILVVLVIAHGLWAIQEILVSALIAVGQVRSLGIAKAITVAFSVPVLAGLVYTAGGLGAAVGSGLVALANVVAFGLLLRRQFEAIVRLQNMGRIAVAAGTMPLVSALSATLGGGIIVSCAVGLVAYAGALILLSEVSAADLVALRSRTPAK